MGRVVGEVAPAMLLSAASQCTCLFIGLMATVPAVNTFALNAGLAVLINFGMQITAFIGLMALDIARMENNRYDLVCCLRNESSEPAESMNLLMKVTEKFYAPAIMNDWVRPTVIVLFFGWLCFSVAVAPQLEVGLDQELSVPDDSYLIKFFDYMQLYLSVGSPFYVVLRNTGKEGYDLSDNDLRFRVCGGSGCNDDSLQSKMKLWSLQSETTYMATPANSWLDDYNVWIRTCCRYNRRTLEVCQSNEGLNLPDIDIMPDIPSPCDPCTGSGSQDTVNITEQAFQENIQWFKDDAPGEKCPSAGMGAYRDGLALKQLNITEERELPQYEVIGSHFMAFHTIVHTSTQFTNAFKWARQLTDELDVTLNVGIEDASKRVEVFPYSVFYVYYESYLTMWEETLVQLAISLAAIFVVMLVLTGLDLASTLIMTLVITMVLVDMLGLMYLWDIQLNGVSLINLVVTIGISVEFCSHITKAYTMTVAESKKERVQKTLVTMGTSVYIHRN